MNLSLNGFETTQDEEKWKRYALLFPTMKSARDYITNNPGHIYHWYHFDNYGMLIWKDRKLIKTPL